MKRRGGRRENKEDAGRHVGLARALSKLGFCSRSAAAGLIHSGRVRLNGTVSRNPEAPTRLTRDRIEVDGKKVREAERIYLMMNKPRGLLTTADDEQGRETIYDILPKGLPWVGPVGRLDKASEGLLLLTNDSEWAARVTAPQRHLDKTYHVQISGTGSDALLRSLLEGVREDQELLKAKKAWLLRRGEKNSWIQIVLDEGKNRQIRRMLEALGVEVMRLVRTAVGSLELGALPKGETRELRSEEKREIDLAMRG